jgi:L,D-peptidoglycan transpeptidase YkuD (ErfK/YbiS/YcfS/YnhG family)
LNRHINLIKVYQSPISRSRGILVAGNIRIPCALGRTGLRYDKREGDGKSPIGVFALHKLWWRDDRFRQPLCALKKRRIRKSDGWCDDARSFSYNKPVQRPFASSHEEMHREDHVYDYVIEIGCNMQARKQKTIIYDKSKLWIPHIGAGGHSPLASGHKSRLRPAGLKRGRGSAIFLHLARDNFEPTAGCVAVPPPKIARLLAVIGPKTKIQIG